MPSPLPPVAVVVTLHNGAPWIRETLASVQAQTHQPAEIVVIDDHSTDDGPARAAAVPGVVVRPLSRPSVQGGGPGRQTGFEQTSAPLVAFLDQDDLWHPDHLKLLAQALLDHPSAPAATSKFNLFVDGSPPSFSTPRRAVRSIDLWADFPFHDIISPSGVLIRRSALEAIGGWPTDGAVTDFQVWFHLSVDHDLVENKCMTCGKRVHRASKLAEIGSNERATYLQYRAARLEAVVEAHRARYPEEAALHDMRLQALYAGGLLAEAFETTNPALVHDAAPPLEALATTDPNAATRLLDFLIRFLLRSAWEGDVARQEALLAFYLSAWPSTAPVFEQQLHALLTRAFSTPAFVRFLREKPAHGLRWRLALDSLSSAVRRRWREARRQVGHAAGLVMNSR